MLNLFLPLALLAALGSTTGVEPVSPQENAGNNTWDPIAVQSGAPGAQQHAVCLKMRVYWFERNDGGAPKLVRETTCSTARPFAKKASTPKARLIPAN